MGNAVPLADADDVGLCERDDVCERLTEASCEDDAVGVSPPDTLCVGGALIDDVPDEEGV